jgi:hypothetical protein
MATMYAKKEEWEIYYVLKRLGETFEIKAILFVWSYWVYTDEPNILAKKTTSQRKIISAIAL